MHDKPLTALRRMSGFAFICLSLVLWGASLAVAWPFRVLYKLCDVVVSKCIDIDKE